MDLREWENILTATLVDGRISDSEKRALEPRLDSVRTDEQKLAMLRGLAFELARQQSAQNPARSIDWLEDFNKLLQPRRDATVSKKPYALFAPDDPIPERIIDLLGGSRGEVLVCVFTITDDRISDAILRAHKKGVEIRIITDDQKALDLGSDIERLERAGIPVRQDKTEAHMHHKFAIFDRDTLLNGSFNWTRGASRVNLENIILQYDRPVIETFRRYFERTWERLA